MLAEAGEDVVEIPGQKRPRAKNDRIDAVQPPARAGSTYQVHRVSAGCVKRCVTC